MKDQREAGISKVVIERPHKKCRVTVHTARPGILIGKKGEKIEKLRQRTRAAHDVGSSSEHPRDQEARDRRDAGRRKHCPAARAPRRVPPRHEARRAVGAASRRASASVSTSPAVWAARKSRARNGTAKAACRCTRCAPTSTSVTACAVTAYGIIGIKVWVFKGEIIEHDPMASEKKARRDAGGRRTASAP